MFPAMRHLAVLLALVACQRAEDKEQKSLEVAKTTTATGSGSAAIARPRTDQVAPPFDLKAPPADATKTASGLIYKKITSKDDGAAPKRNDTVLVLYTGWHQSTGETFVSNKSRGQPW